MKMMKNKGEKIATATVRYLGVAICTIFSCIGIYWLVASVWWCGIGHPKNILWMFCRGLWQAFVAVWYISIPMTAIVILDVQRRLREHRKETTHRDNDPPR